MPCATEGTVVSFCGVRDSLTAASKMRATNRLLSRPQLLIGEMYWSMSRERALLIRIFQIEEASHCSDGQHFRTVFHKVKASHVQYQEAYSSPSKPCSNYHSHGR
jgi:hypothetical protein